MVTSAVRIFRLAQPVSVGPPPHDSQHRAPRAPAISHHGNPVVGEQGATLSEGERQRLYHRPSPVYGAAADVIWVLQDGKIIEQGSFAELLRRQGVFATLYRTQFRRQEIPQDVAS